MNICSLLSSRRHETPIKCYLSAALHFQVMSGQGDLFREKMPLLEYVPRGIHSEQAKKSLPSQPVQLPAAPEAYRQHPLFTLHFDELQVLFYYNDVEVCNPLGSKKKQHKIGNNYNSE